VVKVPRFAFEKFPNADPTLTTTMKSVGEAMAIGRNFTEALQKALAVGGTRRAPVPLAGPGAVEDAAELLAQTAATPTDGRLIAVQQALCGGSHRGGA
jgi:carbamoyl-phosphate synthase large subunit